MDVRGPGGKKQISYSNIAVGELAAKAVCDLAQPILTGPFATFRRWDYESLTLNVALLMSSHARIKVS